ncbi:MAG: response regulator, partial [Polyangiaceae bacterium]
MRVLIAEDDFASRILLESILEKWGYEVVVANDGAAAWRILDADNAPSIAVLDWMMPELSGVELCERVRKRDQELAPYIVMLTARGEKSDVSIGLDAGADDYLVKPFDFTELGARMRVAKRAVALQRDLIESRKAVQYQALHDSSTGALNRGTILNRLSEVLSAGGPATVGLLAIDEHKWLLQHESAESAEAAVRGLVHELRAQSPDALLGRYCADELLVIWPGLEVDAAVDTVARARR